MKLLLTFFTLFLVSIYGSKLPGLKVPNDVVQHYGYIPVNDQYNANLFYWMFEAQNKSNDFVLWLNGGPGCSSLVGLFFENGPYKIDNQTLELTANPYSWNLNLNILYVDQPAPTGFSYANSDYIGNETMVGEEMWVFLTRFFLKYPQYADMNFFIAGESYAGKYVPSIAVKILAENSKKKIINLKGIAIGDGIVDTLLTAKSWAPFLAGNGLISNSKRDFIQTQYFSKCQRDISNGDYSSAFFSCNQVLQACLMDAGNINVYDIRQPCTYPPLCYNMDPITKYLNQPSVQRHLGVNKHWTSCDPGAYAPFETKDFDFSYVYELPICLKQIPVLVYNGNYDLIVDFYGQSEMLNGMTWNGKNGFNQASNVTWTVNGNSAGNSRTYGGLTYLVVFGAGHMVPYDQPINALDMINRFVKNQPFN